jgi:hypothetical protein
VRQITKRTEKSPEATPRSPLKVTTRGREEPEVRSEQDFNKLQDSLKSLKLLLEREKKITARLETENKDLKAQIKSEQEKSEKFQKNIQNLMNNNSITSQENAKLVDEIKGFRENLEGVKEHVKNLAGIIVSVFGFFFAGFEEKEGLVCQEKTRLANKIKEMVLAKFEEIQGSAAVDLNRQVGEVRSWLLVRNFPRQIGLKKEPEISYTVEYFDGNGSLGKSTENTVHSYFTKSDHEEISFHGVKTAIALYDFEGERDDDLTFFCGDTIEILEECDSGWWIGKLNEKTGSFPYNFVQVL